MEEQIGKISGESLMDGKRNIQVGDIVKKSQGYGAHCEWTGLVVGFEENCSKVTVLTEGEIDRWVLKFCELIDGKQ